MVCDLRNLQTTNDVPDVTNIPFWVLQVKNEVAAKIVRVYMADVVGNPREDSHIKVKTILVGKSKLNPLREASVGVAQEELKEISGRSASRLLFANFFMHSPNRYLNEHI